MLTDIDKNSFYKINKYDSNNKILLIKSRQVKKLKTYKCKNLFFKMKKTGVIIIAIFIFLMTNSGLKAIDTGTIALNVAGSECNLKFKTGWNLFSFCSDLDNSDLETVLFPINGKYRYIMRWNTTSQQFDIYSPSSVGDFKQFTILNDNQSYFILMNEDAELNVSGNIPGLEYRNLIRGWTTPSYQYTYSTLIETMIADIKDDFNFLMKWNLTSQEFEIYSKRAIFKPFDSIYKGEGQFIYMENDTILQYK